MNDTELEYLVLFVVMVWSFVGVLLATTAVYHDFQNKRTEKIVWVMLGPIIWFFIFMAWFVGGGLWELIDRKPQGAKSQPVKPKEDVK